MPRALVTAKVIEWARERAELSPEDVAVGGIRSEQIVRWEAGVGNKPTLRQASLLAKALKVPLGYLFLREPPVLPQPLADLRSVTPEYSEMSVDLRQVINDCHVKQDWYREHLIEQGARSLAFVGRFDDTADPDAIALDIRDELGLAALATANTRAASWSEYLRFLTGRAEDIGVSVIRSGIVRSNTRRTLSISEFKGFAIPDPYAPLVFVNARDYITSQIFTLVHELAHIWIASEGVSNVDPEDYLPEYTIAVEALCNAVAAEVLVPKSELESHWTSSASAEDQLQLLAARFRVSAIAVLVKVRQQNLVTSREFSKLRDFLLSESTPRRGSSGGNYHYLFPLRNGRNLSSAMLVATLNGQVAANDAARMLGVKVPTLDRLAADLGLA